ncbi:craniofacial development protein 1 [Chelonus insularis]|uniref:craniofacial development protein 1 n=1 Tax=Chelonus insularis TaxID=460826 RepID=UPI00158A0AB5|nr:craniofacial development protein 1 [Chelonus insularis]XP_034940481.1 craniofacial development protein 1 [Chelonus insularis]XP_034940482.1 craniofacial development protein 1 [Chelonus insularis]XP_034940483.1 craniofacial development protein 1 [Chelonus insularis]
MSEEHQLPSDSDQDDEDYIPDGVEQDVSEAESDEAVESESGQEDENNENEKKSKKKKGKRGKQGRKRTSKKAKVDTETHDSEKEEEEEEKKLLTEEEEKKRADSLWADFMKDTGSTFKPKPQNSTNISSGQQENSSLKRSKTEEKVKITKVFEFAGEEVRIEKQVAADSAEARLVLNSSGDKSADRSAPLDDKKNKPARRGGGLGGISSVLGQIGKKTKISTLEKSKLDWDNFKKEENIDEEINTYNRGKDGYLERQDFLQRADLRQFEIEKNLRTIARRNNR